MTWRKEVTAITIACTMAVSVRAWGQACCAGGSAGRAADDSAAGVKVTVARLRGCAVAQRVLPRHCATAQLRNLLVAALIALAEKVAALSQNLQDTLLELGTRARAVTIPAYGIAKAARAAVTAGDSILPQAAIA